jgi:hypothetical protein
MAIEARLSVSNICWPDGQVAHADAIQTLRMLDVPAIDIAPTKVWPKIITGGGKAVDQDDISDFKSTLKGLEVAAFQSLTFGVTGNIFDDRDVRNALDERMRGVIDLAGRMGVRTLIYGSPKTRTVPAVIRRSEMLDRADDFFAPLSELAADRGVNLGIEPVSPLYAPMPFCASGHGVYRFVSTHHVSESSYGPILVPDSFAMSDAAEDVCEIISAAAGHGKLSSHWQVSEKGMDPVGNLNSVVDHEAFSMAFDGIVTGRIPMLSPTHGRHEAFNGSMTLAIEMYSDPNASIKDQLSHSVRFVREHYPSVSKND